MNQYFHCAPKVQGGQKKCASGWRYMAAFESAAGPHPRCVKQCGGGKVPNSFGTGCTSAG